VLNLLRELAGDFHDSYGFASRDVAVVRDLPHRVILLYSGRIMEAGDAVRLYARPAHPYTQAQLAAPIPDPDPHRQRRAPEVRDYGRRCPESCPFAARALRGSELAARTGTITPRSDSSAAAIARAS
jgi:ABC-type dipeptide/oligopeptide/nickel transport system ATPase component